MLLIYRGDSYNFIAVALVEILIVLAGFAVVSHFHQTLEAQQFGDALSIGGPARAAGGSVAGTVLVGVATGRFAYFF